MKISSPLFGEGQPLPTAYTCDGANINPPLQFTDIPTGAESLVLIMDDPDAPGGTWVHWTVFDMDHTVHFLDEGGKPKGVEGMTSFGKTGYGGACPPNGTHRYFFKLYALNTKLGLPPTVKAEELEAAMQGHILEQAQLMATYTRNAS